MPPVPIEDAVKMELPIISNAMLIGDQRKFLSMLLTLKVRLGVWLGRGGRTGGPPQQKACPAGARVGSRDHILGRPVGYLHRGWCSLWEHALPCAPPPTPTTDNVLL